MIQSRFNLFWKNVPGNLSLTHFHWQARLQVRRWTDNGDKWRRENFSRVKLPEARSSHDNVIMFAAFQETHSWHLCLWKPKLMSTRYQTYSSQCFKTTRTVYILSTYKFGVGLLFLTEPSHVAACIWPTALNAEYGAKLYNTSHSKFIMWPKTRLLYVWVWLSLPFSVSTLENCSFVI